MSKGIKGIGGSDDRKYTKWEQFNVALEKGINCLCGKKLDSNCWVSMRDHEGGIFVPDETVKQWVAVLCDECDFEMSWNKVIRRARV